MKTLITPAQVLSLAFAEAGYIPLESITEADIATAEQRYLRPMLGPKLYARLLEGLYPEFVTNYLILPLALYTRALMQPLIDIHTAHGGATSPRSQNFQPAAEQELRRMQRTLRIKARALLGRAAEHLDQQGARIPEYDPTHNVLNHCRIDGGIVYTD